VQHRSKDNDYFFFYFKDGTIKGSFVPNNKIKATISRECNYYKFRDIWKYENENFYRLNLESSGKQIALVLVLQREQKKFNFSSDSKIPNLEVVDSSDDIKKGSGSFVVSINESILIYFKAE